VVLDAQQEAHYLHVDDGVCLSSGAGEQQRATDMMMAIADSWERLGFVVNDRRPAADLFRVVGYDVFRRPARVALPVAKQAKLHQNLTAMLQAGTVSADELAHHLGVWIWGAVLRRPLLSIPFAIFHQLDRSRGRRIVLWSAVRAEVRAMRDLIPLMYLDVGAEAADYCFATDARGARAGDAGGYGVAVTPLVKDEFVDIFRCARQLSFTVPRLDGAGSGLKYSQGDLHRTVPHTQLPDGLLVQERWRTVESGTWKFLDHITLGEARVVVRLVRRLLASPRWHRKFIFSLEDNGATAGALTKGRSPAPALNYLCRLFAASALAGRMRWLLPWVETARQTADLASRV